MTTPDAPASPAPCGVGPASSASADGVGHPTRHTDSADGSLALEAALVLPLVALCALALLHLVTVTKDALAVQEAARVAARVAATSASDDTVRLAVADVLGVYVMREATVTVTPSPRSAGDTIRVEISLPTRFGPFRPVVHGQATVRGEPVLGEGR